MISTVRKRRMIVIMGKVGELILGLCKQSINDGDYVTPEEIAKHLNASGYKTTRGTPYKEQGNQGIGGIISKEIGDMFNTPGREQDGHIMQESIRGKNGEKLF
ncbi:hypothetical protein [Treponema bryantii]|nr:hypothetical protein [Treponema bryantii]